MNRQSLRHLVLHPILHFLLLGALLLGVRQWVPLAEPQSPVIVVSAEDLEHLRRDWLRDTGRGPSAAELQASVQRHVDEELLLREAIRLGLDRTDPVAHERLVNNMRFAFPGAGADDGQLLEEARRLGMHTRDLVVRRRLVQVMEMRIVSNANFGEAALRDYVAQHPERYSRPARYGFRHWFISGDRAPADAERAAQRLLTQLSSGNRAGETGDPFLLGNRFAPMTETAIARRFGPAFAQALTQTPVGTWSGPVRSSYGLHLVFLETVEPPTPLPFEDVQQRAAYALLAEREKDVLREELAQLRQRYRVEIAAPAESVTLGMLE